MNKSMRILLAVLAMGFGIVAQGATVTVSARGFYADGSSVDGAMTLGYAPTEKQNATVKINDEVVLNAGEAGSFAWYAPTVGTYKVSHTVGDDVLSAMYVVTNGYAKDEANPPMDLVEGITISPMEISAAAKGGRSLITISGNGEAWTGATSADWLTLNSTEGTAEGKKVICTVGENGAAESRVGYVYLAGQTVTVTQAGQAGRGATVDTQVVADTAGGEVSVAVSVTDETTTWGAWSDCSWISVLTQSGTGSGEVKLQVAPWNKFESRTGTVTIAGQIVTVTQEAAVVELSKVSAAVCAQGEDVLIDVSVASSVNWAIANVPEWMTLEGEVQRKGADVVKLTITPNTTFEERSAVLTIAGQEFAVTQAAAKIEFEGSLIRYLSADGGDLEITVRVDVATAPWSIDISENAKDDWVFLLEGDEARVGSDIFTLSVWESSDEGELPREATVTLGTQVLTIRQVAEIPDPVPAVAEDVELASALEGSRDARLAENIKDTTKYAKYHAWVDKVAGTGADHFGTRQAVKDSELTWFAYALDLNALPEKAPTNVVIDTIGTSTEGAWDLEVKVGDLKVGSDAAAADLGTVFVVEGAADLKDEAFSADNVTTTLSAAGDGKVKVGVEPKSAAGQFFIRVKMTP